MITDATHKPAAQTPSAHRRASLYLLYHELTSLDSEYGYALSAKAFREHLQLYTRERKASEASLLPEITFDDGHISNFEHALPLLSQFDLKARFFITAGWTGERPEYMNWSQLQQLGAEGHAIGAHGWSHKLLTHCTEAELETELKVTRLTLEDKLGIPVTTLSLPGGRSNRQVLEACTAAGYVQIFTSMPRPEPVPSAALLGRVNLRSKTTVQQLEALLHPGTGALHRLGKQQRWKETAQRTLGDSLYAKLWALLNRAPADAV